MVNVNSIFNKYNITPTESKFRIVNEISDNITSSKDQIQTSNRIIKDFGLKPLTNLIDSRIVALALIEHALDNQTNFDVESAEKAAMTKLKCIVGEMPFLYNVKENVVMEAVQMNGEVVGYKRPRKENVDKQMKKQKALDIYNANKEKKPTDIAKLIQVELGITFANAYYYVSRVFNKNV